jgi:hypothetical protein
MITHVIKILHNIVDMVATTISLKVPTQTYKHGTPDDLAQGTPFSIPGRYWPRS